jgi:osmotically-inducible protein OsmY
VRVEAGMVTLKGTVTAGWARRQAEELAVVSCVREMRDNLGVRGGRVA